MRPWTTVCRVRSCWWTVAGGQRPTYRWARHRKAVSPKSTHRSIGTSADIQFTLSASSIRRFGPSQASIAAWIWSCATWLGVRLVCRSWIETVCLQNRQHACLRSAALVTRLRERASWLGSVLRLLSVAQNRARLRVSRKRPICSHGRSDNRCDRWDCSPPRQLAESSARSCVVRCWMRT